MEGSGAQVNYLADTFNSIAPIRSEVKAGEVLATRTSAYIGAGTGRELRANVRYNLAVLDSSGSILFSDAFEGTVVTAGLNALLDAAFKTGSSSPTWYVGLLDGAATPVIAAEDVMNSHAGWAENAGYSNSARPAFTPGTIAGGAVDNVASKAVFNINAGGTVVGAFIASSSTKGGSTGTLYDVGLFLDGPRPVANGVTLQVAVTVLVSAS